MGTEVSKRVDIPPRTCGQTHKVCHETKAAADTEAERAMERGDVMPGCHVEAFGCTYCGTFHTGNRHIVFKD